MHSAERYHIWHPYTDMNQWRYSKNRTIVGAEGFHLVDSRGIRYIDGVASMWCNVWGHGEREILKEMINQINTLQHSSLFGLANKPSVELSSELVKLSKGMEYVFYSDNGSTAVEVAMKMALQYYRNRGRPEKKHFISLKQGYHGDTIGAMSVGYLRKFFSTYRPLLKRVAQIPSPSLKLNGSSDRDKVLEVTETYLKKTCNSTCAIIMESGAQIAGGVRIYPPGYQRCIAELAAKYGVLLILDEIATGFGRLGGMVEYLKQGSTPDLVCFGKALTAGYSPLAVTLTNREIFRSFIDTKTTLYHGHTFTGHPIGCATALANLKLFRKRNLLRDVFLKSKYIRKAMHKLQDSPAVSNVRHKGMLAALDVSNSGVIAIREKAGERVDSFIFNNALDHGAYLRPLGNTIVIIPPLAIDQMNLDSLLNVIRNVVNRIEQML